MHFKVYIHYPEFFFSTLSRSTALEDVVAGSDELGEFLGVGDGVADTK
jgi:hypothetical protein